MRGEGAPRSYLSRGNAAELGGGRAAEEAASEDEDDAEPATRPKADPGCDVHDFRAMLSTTLERMALVCDFCASDIPPRQTYWHCTTFAIRRTTLSATARATFARRATSPTSTPPAGRSPPRSCPQRRGACSRPRCLARVHLQRRGVGRGPGGGVRRARRRPRITCARRSAEARGPSLRKATVGTRCGYGGGIGAATAARAPAGRKPPARRAAPWVPADATRASVARTRQVRVRVRRGGRGLPR